LKDETRGVITIVVVVAVYLGAVGLRRASREPAGLFITRELGSRAGDILQSDVVVLVPEAEGGIELWPRGAARGERIPDREALVRWLCSDDAPREISVVMLKGVPVGRGRIESASRADRLAIEELRVPAIPIACPTRAKFFSLELRLADER
jgi:hypothetical protein